MGAGVGDGGHRDQPWREYQLRGGSGAGSGGAYQDLPTPPPVRRQAPGPWGDPAGWRSGYLPGPEDRPEPPAMMRRATALMCVGAGLTVLSTIVAFAMADQLADALTEATAAPEAVVDRAVADQQVQNVIQMVVGVALWAWMAIKNGEGRRWARVVATIFGIINVFGFLLGFALVEGLDLGDSLEYLMPQVLLGTVSVVLGVVILFQLHHPESAHYYDEAERYHAAMTLRGYR